MDNLNQDLTSLLRRAGLDNSGGEWGSRILLVAGIVLICYLAVKLFRHLVTPALQRISAQTRTMWDDHLFDDKVLHAACRLIPPVLLYLLLPLAFGDDPSLLKLLHKGCSIYLIVVTIALLNTFLSALYDISNKHETLRDRPLKGIYQMLKLVTVSVGIVLIIGILIDRNATSILAGLGASAAVLMLIFKDSILGLVAGVQLSANDMLRPGDWITMSKYGADGYVIEVTLTTVKVQNFDKTITTIPPYALVSDSFQNWRGMRECGGRRIKRSVFIDARTIRRCTPEETARLREKGYLAADTSQEIVNLRPKACLWSSTASRATSNGFPTKRSRAHLPTACSPFCRSSACRRSSGLRAPICMNGTDGIRTQEECLFSDAKRALSPRRSVSLQRFFRKRCAKYHEIRFACVRSCRRSARTSAKDGPTKDGEGRTPSPPYRILCLRTETHADIAHDDGIKAHVCRCMRRIGIATARRPLLRIHRRKGTKRGRVVKTLPRIVLRRDGGETIPAI